MFFVLCLTSGHLRLEFLVREIVGLVSRHLEFLVCAERKRNLRSSLQKLNETVSGFLYCSWHDMCLLQSNVLYSYTTNQHKCITYTSSKLISINSYTLNVILIYLDPWYSSFKRCSKNNCNPLHRWRHRNLAGKKHNGANVGSWRKLADKNRKKIRFEFTDRSVVKTVWLF